IAIESKDLIRILGETHGCGTADPGSCPGHDRGEQFGGSVPSHTADLQFCRCLPSPTASTSTTSPDCRYRGGVLPMPAPAGVPVLIMSPGSSTMNWLRYQTR